MTLLGNGGVDVNVGGVCGSLVLVRIIGGNIVWSNEVWTGIRT